VQCLHPSPGTHHKQDFMHSECSLHSSSSNCTSAISSSSNMLT
jgi:hypothetical protein